MKSWVGWYSGGRDQTGGSVSSRSAWSTKQAPGQPGLSTQREPFLTNKRCLPPLEEQDMRRKTVAALFLSPLGDIACRGYFDRIFNLGTQMLKLNYKSFKISQQVLMITKMLAINTVTILNINHKVLKYTVMYTYTYTYRYAYPYTTYC